jgi:hypothetical protein
MNDFEPKPLTNSAQPPLVVETNSKVTAFTGFLKANRLYLGFIFFGLLIIGVLAYLAFRHVPVKPVKEANVNLEI